MTTDTFREAPAFRGPREYGLRTRYFPRARIGQGLISVAPWLDAVLLLIFFFVVDSQVILQPGVVVELPQSRFKEGTRLGLTAVIVSVGGGSDQWREEIIFFDDERFLVKNEGQMEALKQAFGAWGREHPDQPLVIHADRRVSHGTVLSVMDMALEVGIPKVNVATRPF